MDAAEYYVVRSAVQSKKTNELHIKLDYYSMYLDMDDCLHGSFVPATKAYYESADFIVISCNQRAISEREYLDEMD